MNGRRRADDSVSDGSEAAVSRPPVVVEQLEMFPYHFFSFPIPIQIPDPELRLGSFSARRSERTNSSPSDFPALTMNSRRSKPPVFEMFSARVLNELVM